MRKKKKKKKKKGGRRDVLPAPPGVELSFFAEGPNGGVMSADLSVIFTGIRFENPFLLSSAPPTESESNILRAFEAGWGGVVTKTIGLHPVVNVRGPKTKFLRADVDNPRLSMKKRPARRSTPPGTGS